MNSFLNLSTNAIKTADSLIKHAKEETYDEVEDSIKSLRKNFKAGNYFAIATFSFTEVSVCVISLVTSFDKLLKEAVIVLKELLILSFRLDKLSLNSVTLIISI